MYGCFLNALFDVVGEKYSPFTANEYALIPTNDFAVQLRETPISNVLEIGKYSYENGTYNISLQYYTDKYLKSFGIRSKETYNKL